MLATEGKNKTFDETLTLLLEKLWVSSLFFGQMSG